MFKIFKSKYVKSVVIPFVIMLLNVQCALYASATFVNVETTVAALPIEVVNDDFKDGTVGESIHVFNGWEEYIASQTSSETKLNSKILFADDDDNKVLSLVRESASDNTCRDNYAKRQVNIPIGTDKIGISFRIKSMDEDNGKIRLLLFNRDKLPGDTEEVDRNAELQIDLQNSSISSINIGMPETYFEGKAEPVAVNEWNTVEVMFYTETKHMEFYVNGDMRSRTYFEMDTARVGNITEGKLDAVAIGTLRASGVKEGGDSALVYIDDFAVRTEGQYDSLVSDIELLNNKVFSLGVSFKSTPAAHTKAILASYVYDNGFKRFVSAELVDFNGTDVKTLDTPFEIPENGELRAFVFGFTNMRPLAKVKSYYTASTKYVSPSGNDNNDGSEKSPWKTLSKAANEARAGDTILLADGEYHEDFTTILRKSGTAEKPITIKAVNKGKATVIYDEKLNTGWKFLIPDDIDYINIEDINFTQEIPNPDTNATQDIILYCMGDNCIIKNNSFSNAMEEGIKLYNSTNTVIEGNYITAMTHEGMDIFNCDGVVVRNNEIADVGRMGILFKGNSRNCAAYNNYIHADDVYMTHGAISIGGSSDNTSPWDIKEGTGHECYSTVVYNNVIAAKTKTNIEGIENPNSYSANGAIRRGISLEGAIDCHVYNNTIVGPLDGISLSSAQSQQWGWYPPVISPNIKNNIMVDCNVSMRLEGSRKAVDGITIQNSVVDSYGNSIVEANSGGWTVFKDNSSYCSNNLYYGYYTGREGSIDWNETGRVTADPMLDANFSLQAGSPAIGKGCELPTVFNRYEWSEESETIVKTDNEFIITFNNPPNIGAY